MASRENSYEMSLASSKDQRPPSHSSHPTHPSHPTYPPGLGGKTNGSSTSITQIEDVYSRFKKNMEVYGNTNRSDEEIPEDTKTPLVSVHVLEEHPGVASSQTTIKPQDMGLKDGPEQEYRLYKRRWVGVVALVLLNIIKGCNWVWFGSIANSMTETFGFTLGQVNMFGNIPHISYIVFSWCVPLLVRRWGLRWSTVFGATILLLSAWIRYCGTIKSLPVNGSYALMLIAQLLVGVTAPCFQVVGPRYAEVWFDLKGRATTTMIVAISDPLGTAVGQIVAPFLTNLRFGILVLALATTISFPLAFLVLPSPPSPPTYSGSLISPPFLQTMRAAFGRARPGEQYLTNTERLDFFILFFIFGVLIAGTSSFSVFISQIFQPHGYSEITSGLMGGIFLISGLVAAILSAPIFDRVLVYHLARTVKIILPILGVCWIGLIFAVKPNNLAGIYVVLVSIASFSFILLPVGLELGVEITRNAETSTAVLWSGGNAISFVWVVVMNALRASNSANPPLNMKRALIFNASFICATASLGIFFTGKQTRREMDEVMAKRNREEHMGVQG